MTFEPISIQMRGHVARAMAQVHQQKKPDQDVSGRISCPRCHSPLAFTVLRNGLSRGRCAQSGCVAWVQ